MDVQTAAKLAQLANRLDLPLLATLALQRFVGADPTELDAQTPRRC